MGSDYIYDSIHCSVADGIDNLTRNLMQTRPGGGDELRTFNETMSMRPLMMKSLGNNAPTYESVLSE